mmetsp:Transcript_140122/g.447138  ORF Transcript_140122/g.447138 Transcript_140122/m.447138 type:complete len:314 (-) Transcript_140122:324-1265(-)
MGTVHRAQQPLVRPMLALQPMLLAFCPRALLQAGSEEAFANASRVAASAILEQVNASSQPGWMAPPCPAGYGIGHRSHCNGGCEGCLHYYIGDGDESGETEEAYSGELDLEDYEKSLFGWGEIPPFPGGDAEQRSGEGSCFPAWAAEAAARSGVPGLVGWSHAASRLEGGTNKQRCEAPGSGEGSCFPYWAAEAKARLCVPGLATTVSATSCVNVGKTKFCATNGDRTRWADDSSEGNMELPFVTVGNTKKTIKPGRRAKPFRPELASRGCRGAQAADPHVECDEELWVMALKHRLRLDVETGGPLAGNQCIS